MSRNFSRSHNVILAAVYPVASFPFVVEQQSLGYTGFELIINSTARTGGTSITPSIEEWDPAAQAWEVVPLLLGAAITTADTRVVLLVGPNVTAAANVAARRVAPKRWRLRVTQEGGITSAAFSAGVNYFDS